MATFKLTIGAAGLHPAWLGSLVDDQWVQSGSNTIEDIDARYDPLANPNYPARGPWTYTSSTVTNQADLSTLLAAWNGGAYDRITKRLMLHGGGHGDYGGNEIVRLALLGASPEYGMHVNPYIGTGVDGNLDDGNEALNRYAVNQPRSIHSYECLQIVGGYLYQASSPAPFLSASTTYGSMWRCNLTTGVWEQLLQETNSGSAGRFYSAAVTCYDSYRNRIYGWNNNAAYPNYYDITANTFNTDTVVQPNIQATEAYLIYIPELDVQLCLYKDYDNFIGIYDYGVTLNSGFVNEPGATGDAPGVSPTYSTIGYDARMYPNAVWVPGYGGGVGAVMCWHGGRSLYVLTPPASGNVATTAWAWTVKTISTGTDPGAVNPTGIWGRLFYDPDYRVLGLVKSYTAAPYWFKLPDSDF